MESVGTPQRLVHKFFVMKASEFDYMCSFRVTAGSHFRRTLGRLLCSWPIKALV